MTLAHCNRGFIEGFQEAFCSSDSLLDPVAPPLQKR
jgi:hypothetical protein